MYWRGATKWAAWLTVLFSVGVFFVAPIVIPMVEPDLKTQREYLVATQVKTITTTRPATPVDVARRQAEIQNWEEAQERLDEARAEFTSLLAELTDRDLSASELEVFISEQPKLQVAMPKSSRQKKNWKFSVRSRLPLLLAVHSDTSSKGEAMRSSGVVDWSIEIPVSQRRSWPSSVKSTTTSKDIERRRRPLTTNLCKVWGGSMSNSSPIARSVSISASLTDRRWKPCESF